MQCGEFEDRLNAVLDERQRPEWDAELHLHCETCPCCRQLAATYDRLLDGFYARVGARRSARHGAACRGRIAAAARVRRRRLAIGTGMLATAASVLAVVGLLSSNAIRQGEQPSGAPRVARVTESPPNQASLETKLLVSDLTSLAASAGGDPYAGLAKETGQGLATVMLYVPGVGGGRGIIDAEVDRRAGEPAWAVQMSEGLRPITNSVTETFNLLLRSMPVSQLAARS